MYLEHRVAIAYEKDSSIFYLGLFKLKVKVVAVEASSNISDKQDKKICSVCATHWWESI